MQGLFLFDSKIFLCFYVEFCYNKIYADNKQDNIKDKFKVSLYVYNLVNTNRRFSECLYQKNK